MIKTVNISIMLHGVILEKINQKGNTFVVFRLSPSEKHIDFGELPDPTKIQPNEIITIPTKDKIPIQDIQNLVEESSRHALYGYLDMTNSKGSLRKKDTKDIIILENPALTFSIIFKNTSKYDSMTFLCPTRKDYVRWYDGLRQMVGLDLQTEESKSDLETLRTVHAFRKIYGGDLLA